MPDCNGERRDHSRGKRGKKFPVIVDKTKDAQKKADLICFELVLQWWCWWGLSSLEWRNAVFNLKQSFAVAKWPHLINKEHGPIL